MTEFELTAKRRSELLTLLDDEERLHIEHPSVAEYLETAPGLEGVNPETDAAFDLRFVHYMTSPSASSNPYWDTVRMAVSHDRHRGRVVNGGNTHGSARLGFAQMILQEFYSFAIPSPETISWISEFCTGLPIVELGAGRGYWASRLTEANLDVTAYDIETPEDPWYRIHELSHLKFESEQVLFLCWPPGWENEMASQVLEQFEASGGNRLIYIGEPKGGKTANHKFFEALSERWQLTSLDPQHVSWWNLHDNAQGWVRN